MAYFFLFDVGGEISELTTDMRKHGSLIKKAEFHSPIQLHGGLPSYRAVYINCTL